MTDIGNRAFSCCRSLPNIVIPNSVTKIGDYAFSDCSSLSKIVIPNSVTDIGDSAFFGCSLSYDFEQELISRFGNKIFSNYDTN